MNCYSANTLIVKEVKTMTLTKEDLQAIAELFNPRFDKIESRLDAIEERLDAVEIRLDAMDIRLTNLELNFSRIESRLTNLEIDFSKMEARLTNLEFGFSKIVIWSDEAQSNIHSLMSRQRRYMAKH